MAADSSSETAIPNLSSGLRLDELLREVQDRLAEIMATRDRMQGLLDAFLAVGTGLELDTTLRRLVEAAVNLVQARYGALGVLGAHGGLSRFLYVGIDEATRAEMGHLPEGKGCWDSSSQPAPVAAGRPEHAQRLDRLSTAPPADESTVPRRRCTDRSSLCRCKPPTR